MGKSTIIPKYTIYSYSTNPNPIFKMLIVLHGDGSAVYLWPNPKKPKTQDCTDGKGCFILPGLCVWVFIILQCLPEGRTVVCFCPGLRSNHTTQWYHVREYRCTLGNTLLCACCTPVTLLLSFSEFRESTVFSLTFFLVIIVFSTLCPQKCGCWGI